MFKRVGLFNKETNDKIVIVNYIKITVSTSTKTVYAARNSHNNSTLLLFNYSTIPLP